VQTEKFYLKNTPIWQTTILAGINQVILLALSMVVTSMVGAKDRK
jgi:ABC-type proline/glycine betaine transport system permease subunit